MTAHLDDLLKSAPPASSAAARLRARAALEAELKKPVKRATWRRDVLLAVAATVGLIVLVASAMIAVGMVPAELAGRRAPSLALLLTTAALAGYAAIAPRRRVLRMTGVALGLASAAAIVIGRWDQGTPNALPEWVCTASHLAVAIVPIGVAVMLLRRAAPNLLRFVVGGLGVGTVGAALGQLACGDDGQHVLVYHVGAWVLVTAVTLLVARAVKPTSYAP